MAIHLKTIRGSKFTQILYGKSLQEKFCGIQNFSDTKIPQTFPDLTKFWIHDLAVIILYRIHIP